MCFWLSTRTMNEGTFTICLPTLQQGSAQMVSSVRCLTALLYSRICALSRTSCLGMLLACCNRPES